MTSSCVSRFCNSTIPNLAVWNISIAYVVKQNPFTQAENSSPSIIRRAEISVRHTELKIFSCNCSFLQEFFKKVGMKFQRIMVGWNFPQNRHLRTESWSKKLILHYQSFYKLLFKLISLTISRFCFIKLIKYPQNASALQSFFVSKQHGISNGLIQCLA